MEKSSSFLPTPSSNQNQTHTPNKSLLNLDPLSVKPPTYTSLRDVLPFSPTIAAAAAAVNHPAASHHHHVSIRNRLVKQAAWAYLQPMSTSPSGPSCPHFFRRLHNRYSSPTHNNPLAACINFIYHHILPSFTRTVQRILHAIPCFLRAIEE